MQTINTQREDEGMGHRWGAQLNIITNTKHKEHKTDIIKQEATKTNRQTY